MKRLDDAEIAERVRRSGDLMRQLGDGRADRDRLMPSTAIMGPAFDNEFGCISLQTQAELDAYNRRLELLEAVGDQRTISKTSVRDLLNRALTRATTAKRPGTFEERIAASLDDLVTELDKTPSSWTITIPVHGFGCLPVQFGGIDFVDQAMTRHRVHALRAPRALHELDEEELKADAYAIRIVDAVDADYACELGEAAIAEAIDILSFFADVMRRSPLPATVGIGPTEPASNTMVAWSGDRVVAQYRHDRTRAAFSARNQDEATAFARASNIVERRATAEPLERRTLTALRAAGQGAASNQGARNLVGYVSALDTLLCSGESSAVKLATRVTHLLGGDAGYRRSVFSTIKECYRARSLVLHEGVLVVDPAHHANARGLCIRTLLHVLSAKPFCEMMRNEELDAWFEQQLLGGGT